MSGKWLVSRRFDLWMFLAPALLALALVPLEPLLAPDGETPLPMWVVAVLFVDVAHVWSTIYRTYLDPVELRRRLRLYIAAPIVAYAFGFLLMRVSYATFWTGLAYLAVFHFVRQQYGWVALYHRRDPDSTRLDRRLDALVVYAATIYPLIWWHAHLPRKFNWFLPGDFQIPVPLGLSDGLGILYAVLLGLWAARQIQRRFLQRVEWPIGRIIVITTTAACWGIGIVVTNSDWAFTVTNVLIHGVPYFGIVWIYGCNAERERKSSAFLSWLFKGRHVVLFYGLVVGLAYLEEWGWHRTVWHDKNNVFIGPNFAVNEATLAMIVPLLALPQVTHYILDGFIWRRGARPAS